MASPPVCRIMDYGKFRYEESQKAKESRKKTIQVSIKEVKFRPKIGKGDFDTQVRHMQDFLADGHKVKVTLQFRGREMAHPELGSRILDAVIEQVGSHGKVETMARLEGRNMTMVLAPEKKAVVKKPHEPRAASHESKAADGAKAPAQPDQPEDPVQPEDAIQQAPAEPVAEAVVETADPA
jgi:translation initiation factor IF-3